MFQCFASSIHERPSAYAQTLTAFDFALGPTSEIVIAEGKNNESASAMLKVLNQKFIPNHVLVWRPLKDTGALFSIVPFVKEQAPLDDRTTVYVCKNHACKQPVTTMEEVDKITSHS